MTDIKGPMSVDGIHREKYFQIFVEKDTKFVYTFCMESKSDAIYNLSALFSEFKRLSSRVYIYHSDGAAELTSSAIQEKLQEYGCRLTYSPPYTPELNGQAERSIQSIVKQRGQFNRYGSWHTL